MQYIRIVLNENIVKSVLAKVMVKVKHPGILELRPGTFMKKKPGYFISLAKKKGLAPIMRALLNLERWNKGKGGARGSIAAHARTIIDKLKKNKSLH